MPAKLNRFFQKAKQMEYIQKERNRKSQAERSMRIQRTSGLKKDLKSNQKGIRMSARKALGIKFNKKK